MINVQYRMHDKLYAHLVKVIYKKPIDSTRKSSDDSPYLKPSSANPSRPWRDQAKSKNSAPSSIFSMSTTESRSRKLLWTKAVANGRADVNSIGTIDSSQVSQYKIVILSLVTTDGFPKFHGRLAPRQRSYLAPTRGAVSRRQVSISVRGSEGPTFVVGSQRLAPDQANPAPEVAGEPVVEEEEEGDVGQAETDSLGRAYERAMMNKLMTLEELKERARKRPRACRVKKRRGCQAARNAGGQCADMEHLHEISSSWTTRRFMLGLAGGSGSYSATRMRWRRG
ncbi:MAG: hypothetical protein Q9177_003449 [Variospora cf. flavescens]